MSLNAGRDIRVSDPKLTLTSLSRLGNYGRIETLREIRRQRNKLRALRLLRRLPACLDALIGNELIEPDERVGGVAGNDRVPRATRWDA